MKKRCKQVVLKGNVYFTIYSYIKENLCPSQIAKKLNVSRQTLNRYIRCLKANGYIEKIGYGVWKAKEDIKDVNFDLNTLPKSSKHNIRSHAFIFSLSLPKIKNWENREEFLKSNKIEYSNFSNRNQQKILFRKIKVHISNKKIVVYFPKWKSYFVNSAREGYNYAIYDFEQLIKGLERLFGASFTINRAYKFKVSRQHQAIINSELAKMFNRKKEKLYIKDEKGFLWLLIDNSTFDSIGLNEEECVNNETAITDNELIQKNYNELRETKLTPKLTLEMINKVTANQMMFAENMKSHIEAIQTLSKGVKKLSVEVSKFHKK